MTSDPNDAPRRMMTQINLTTAVVALAEKMARAPTTAHAAFRDNPNYNAAWIIVSAGLVDAAAALEAIGARSIPVPTHVVEKRAKLDRRNARRATAKARMAQMNTRPGAAKRDIEWIKWKARQLLGLDEDAEVFLSWKLGRPKMIAAPLDRDGRVDHSKSITFDVPEHARFVRNADTWHRKHQATTTVVTEGVPEHG